MSRSVYDTRFSIEHFYSSDDRVLRKTRSELETKREKRVSTIVLHELYGISLKKEGRSIAKLRVEVLRAHFRTVDVDAKIAVQAAELRHRYKIPMGDSIIAATSQLLKASCVTDDPYFTRVREIKTRWIK